MALEYDLVGVNEVVVVGYGTQIKSKVTGSISKVEGATLQNIPVPTVEQALQGKTAGCIYRICEREINRYHQYEDSEDHHQFPQLTSHYLW
jgi:hypothetical protein